MAKKTATRKARKASNRPAKTHSQTSKRRTTAPMPPGPEIRTGVGAASNRFPIVAVGASAGGLEAFTNFLKALPDHTGMSFILCQHMDPTHKSILASLLQRFTQMPIREVTDKTVVEPNHVYILPPNSLMTISNGVLLLTSRGRRTYKDYPIDQFFVSLAEDRRDCAIGVVLSGTATDGTRGLQAINAEGGITFAQDPNSAQFPGMPASAIASGCVDFSLPADEIALELSRISGHPYIQRVSSPEPLAPSSQPDELYKILRQLRVVTGVDFGLYKPAMIGRRVARRMALQKINSHDQYLELIKKDRAELMALYDDIFIHVTGFFRDTENLRALQQRVLSNSTPRKGIRSIRIWVAGCSTGEEVYSIAMLLFEQLGERRNEVTTQIFGTDISEQSIRQARAGIYSPESMVDVSLDRQKRFFVRADGNFQVTKAIRDMCVFAKHDLTKDPPFSRMDLISCRNVLIYMGPQLQKKVIEAFHHALNPGGCLLLGKSESLGACSSLFRVVDPKHRIVTRRTLESPLWVHSRQSEKSSTEKELAPDRAVLPVSDIRREAERLLLDKYTPAALVLDSNLQIIHFQGNTGPFLAPASGEPSFHLLRIIRPELLADMRTAIYSAKKERAPVHKEGIRLKQNGDSVTVDIYVQPINPRLDGESDYLVVFRETDRSTAQAATETKGSPRLNGDRAKTELAARQKEIAALREQLHDLVREHEAADEEVRAMNEEMLSSNEELQSTNEELETAKEELESTNEELTTLNDELQRRNSDLSLISDDLNNLLVAVDIPILILDVNQKIRRFTPAAGHALHLIPADLGRPLSDIANTLQSVTWGEVITNVLASGKPLEREVQNREGHWYTLRVRPYYSGTERPGGILIALSDVDILKRSIEEAVSARKRAEDLEARLALAGEGLRIGMWMFDIASGGIRGSRQWSDLYGLSPDQSWTREEWLARVHPEDRRAVREDLDRLITSGKISNLEYRVVWPDGSIHWLNRRAELVRDTQGNPTSIRGVSIDISAPKSVEQERQAFAARIASAQEGERRRIARELHDGLIQDLAGVAMELGRRVAAPPSSTQLKQDLRSLQDRVIKAAEAARHVAYELHPTEVDDLGLEKALRAYCDELSKENGINIRFQSRKVPKALKRETASCLYKVAQEGLRNVLKHTNAKRAKLTLTTVDGHIQLRLDDDGQGFQISSLQGAAGLGIAGMRERVQLVNGKFDINSEPGKGTQVVAEIPLADPGENV